MYSKNKLEGTFDSKIKDTKIKVKRGSCCESKWLI